MDDTTKYLIHARIAANGVVERSDVVGAVFGQTEGLLGDELDLRDLQQSSKVGRIDVQISAENGQSFGELTIATSLDKAETAILGASLETIERVGPCRADIEVTEIEDVRAAKRREVVDRAKELLAEAFDETIVSTQELVDDVRESVRVDDVAEYAGLPAGPRVATSDAVIVVEGRADVRQLLQYGIKNAIAVEGTDVPEAVAALSAERTTTVFVDGDRGGELILRELLQVGDVDFVAFAPSGRSVEDLSRSDVLAMLRRKVAASRLGDPANVRETIAEIVADAEADAAGETVDVDETDHVETTGDAETTDDVETTDAPGVGVEIEPTDVGAVDDDRATDTSTEEAASADDPNDHRTDATDIQVARPGGETDSDAVPADSDTAADGRDAIEDRDDERQPATLRRQVREVIDGGRGSARLLDSSFEPLEEADLDGLIEAIDGTDAVFSIVVDGELTQRVLDAAAQRGVDHVVARETGDFVKKPVGTRVLTADQLRTPEPEIEV